MTRPLYRNTAEQIFEAYAVMAEEARYRPAAPSDGWGHITVPERELDLAAEQWDYAHGWVEQEDSGDFHVGCANFSQRKAMIYLIEAARACCAGFGGPLARKLTALAVAELELEDRS